MYCRGLNFDAKLSHLNFHKHFAALTCHAGWAVFWSPLWGAACLPKLLPIHTMISLSVTIKVSVSLSLSLSLSLSHAHTHTLYLSLALVLSPCRSVHVSRCFQLLPLCIYAIDCATSQYRIFNIITLAASLIVLIHSTRLNEITN